MKDFTKGTLWGRVEPKYCDSMLTGKKSQQKLRFSKIKWGSQWNKQPFWLSSTPEFPSDCTGLIILWRPQFIHPYYWMDCLRCSLERDLLHVKTSQVYFWHNATGGSRVHWAMPQTHILILWLVQKRKKNVTWIKVEFPWFLNSTSFLQTLCLLLQPRPVQSTSRSHETGLVG